MNRKELFEQIQAKKSMLCVGLDVDFDKMPEHIKALANKGELAIKGELYKGKARSIIEFNKAIVDATAEHCVAYKPNLAFYECYGIDGLRALDATVDYIRMKYPEIFLIADAKRGDIGNTAKMYAKAFFEEMDFDAVTIAPDYVKVEVIPHHGGDGFLIPISSPAYKAAEKAMTEVYGIEPVPSRGGGSIPILADLQRILGIDPLLMGFGLERDTIHSPNESYLLKQLFAGMEAIALFYRYY